MAFTGIAPKSPLHDLQNILGKHGSTWLDEELRYVQEWMVETQLKRALFFIALSLMKRAFFATAEDTKEIAQEMFGVAFSRIARKYDPSHASHCGFEGYFFRCVQYYCQRWAKKRFRLLFVPLQGTDDLPAYEAVVDSSEEEINQHIDAECLVRQLMARRLTPRERKFLACFLHGEDLPEIAQDLGLTIGAAKKLRSRLFKKLRDGGLPGGLSAGTSERGEL
jgi:RNA polymerase sigma factor (sigma-70 family)